VSPDDPGVAHATWSGPDEEVGQRRPWTLLPRNLRAGVLGVLVERGDVVRIPNDGRSARNGISRTLAAGHEGPKTGAAHRGALGVEEPPDALAQERR